jgi:hypothetical protein
MDAIQKHTHNPSRHISRKELPRLMAFSAPGGIQKTGRLMRVATRQYAVGSAGEEQRCDREWPGLEGNKIQLLITVNSFDVMSRFNA